MFKKAKVTKIFLIFSTGSFIALDLRCSLWSISSKLLYMGRVSIKGHFLHIHLLERLSFLHRLAFCSGVESSVVEAHVGYFPDSLVFHGFTVCLYAKTTLT